MILRCSRCAERKIRSHESRWRRRGGFPACQQSLFGIGYDANMKLVSFIGMDGPAHEGWREFGSGLEFWQGSFFLLFLALFLQGAAHRAGGFATEGGTERSADSLLGTAFLDHIGPCPCLGQHQMSIEHREGCDEAKTFYEPVGHGLVSVMIDS